MVILSEDSCHCNAMQCNFNEGDKLNAHRPLPITVSQREFGNFWGAQFVHDMIPSPIIIFLTLVHFELQGALVLVVFAVEIVVVAA